MIKRLIHKGVNVFRLNCSHSKHEDMRDVIEIIRITAKESSLVCPAILIDLQGPKIRIARFKDGSVHLQEGQQFILDQDCPKTDGDETRVGFHYDNLVKDVGIGDELILDDGNMTLEVVAKTKRAIKTRVITTGILGSNKGINLKDGGLTAPSFTEKDARDLDFAIEQDVDFVALSFVKNANDVFSVREKITQSKKYIQVISKIERSDALKYIDEIAKVSHGLMIARGDLALEIGFAKVPAVQKQIIKVGKQNNNFVIVATQMMESMITNNHPTRAEVSDVANAILDHADALMLSAETAMGVHPDHVVQSMNEICLETESHVKYLKLERQLQPDTKNVSMVIADQAIQVGHVLGAKAVVIFTEFGATVQYASRHDSKIPIFGMSRINKTCQRTQIYRGVTPIGVTYDRLDYENINIMAAKHLRPIIDFNDEDLVVIVKGDMIGVTGHTNSLEVWSANMLLGDMSVSQQYEESDC